MIAVTVSPRALPCLLAGLMSLVALGRAHASDNSNSTLDVGELLTGTGSGVRISETSPPPPKPPSLQVLQQELATQEQTLAEQQAGLTGAQNMLAFFQNQASQLAQDAQDPETPSDQQAEDTLEVQELQATDIQEWTQTVTSEQKLLTAIQLQITRLQAQIAAAQ